MSAAIPVALTIAGSDSGGGAGLQADLRTFACHQVHGTCAITCVTAQNTCAVERVEVLPPEMVVAQAEAVVSDIGVDALKTGLLPNAEVMGAIATFLPTLNSIPIVIDPVMVTRAGVVLLAADAIATLTQTLIPQATVLTPNRYEAQMLSGQTIETLADMEQAAQKIHALGPQAVLVKGGGCTDRLRGIDVWFDGHQLKILKTQPVDTPNTHGTGCTLSAAITAHLARGYSPLAATQAAKQYVTTALHHALDIGHGQGPVGHWFPLTGTPQVGDAPVIVQRN